MSRNHIFLLSGIGSIVLGILLYFFFMPLPGNTEGWTVKVEGNRRLGTSEIQKLVLYLIRSSDSFSSRELKNALMLNPYILSAEVHLLPGKTISIKIKEAEITYLEHLNEIAEKSADGQILQEKLSGIDKTNFSEMPIFYLTDSTAQLPTVLAQKRDIIQLWKETRYLYAFLWQRVSEISLTADGSVTLFAAANRASLRLEMPLNRQTLPTVWAVLFYLESSRSQDWLEIRIRKQDAVIKKVH